MHRIQFTTFLKLLSQTTHQKTRSYRRYDEAGGYDYYQSFKRAAERLTVKGEPLKRALRVVEALVNESERDNNSAAVAALAEWLGPRNTFFQPPKSVYQSPSKVLTVILKPEVCRSHKGRRQVIAVWNTRDVPLNPSVAGVGVHMLQEKLGHGEFADCTFHVLDMVRGRLYGPGSIPNDVHSMLAVEFAIADRLLSEDDAA